jgi:hypothetical protein
MPRSLPTFLLLSLLTLGASAQLSGPASRAPDLRELIRRSGAVFVGTVTSIEFKKAPSAVNSVRVTFRVQQGIRGRARAGQSFSIEEWAGLWAEGPSYRVGERLALFVYPTSRLGLTSPVAGRWGRWPVTARGAVQLPAGWGRELAISSPSPGGSVALPVFVRAVRRLAEER